MLCSVIYGIARERKPSPFYAIPSSWAALYVEKGKGDTPKACGKRNKGKKEKEKKERKKKKENYQNTI